MNKFFNYFLLLSIFFYSDLFGQEQYNAFVAAGVKWTTNRIKVSWINPEPSNNQQRQWVQNAIRDTWEKESNVKFIWCNNNENDNGIRILINDENPHTNGLGNELAKNEVGMVLNFDFENWPPIENGTHSQVMNRYEYYIRVIAVHEFGHALGFDHEQKRTDCPVCDRGKKGQSTKRSFSQGDWWTSTCDVNSVMNYCNPRYNNDGKLSSDDIEGVRALYGNPVALNPGANSKTARLVHSTTNLEDGKSLIKIFLTADNLELSEITKIKYHLDSRFNPNEIPSNSSDNKFSLDIIVTNSIDFKVAATVYYSNGSTIEISRYVNFNKPSIGSISNTDIKINFSKRTLANNRYLFSFSIDPDSEIFDDIVRVEYTRNHHTFRIKTLTADNESDNYKVDWNGWGCIPIKIKVYYTENGTLYYKNLTYDMCRALGWE